MSNKTKKNDNAKKKIQKMIKKEKFNPFTWLLIGIVIWSLLSLFFPLDDSSTAKEVPLADVINQTKEGNVKRITLNDNKLIVDLSNGEKISSTKEPQISLYEILSTQNIEISKIPEGIVNKKPIAWVEIISSLAVPLLTLVFIWWIFRQAGRSSGGLFNLGKSQARLFNANSKNKIGFKDVAGAKEIKDELVEVVDFLKNPEKYRKLGARIPKGILLIGPSGVGKTLLARAIAGEANVPFYSVAGSEFIEMIVGVGSARVRDLFRVAKETAPSLIFIDEIDAIGRHRGKATAMSNDEREQTLNQILVEMDGFDPRTNVILIAATNRPDMLDTALVRPGRFDRQIKIDLPDMEEREGIIQIHMKGKPFSSDVDSKKLSKMTVGFSGADIENMLNEAAILAARKNAVEIGSSDLIEASTKVKLGPGRKRVQSEQERMVIAYHEAGHALVSALNPNADPVNRISIVSRSMSLGHTEYLPNENDYNRTKKKLLALVESLLGGRAAEENVFGEETIGAANDIERASAIARKMVMDFGMSSLGPINFINQNSVFADMSYQDKPFGYSEEIARTIDEEVRKIIQGEYEKARKTLMDNRKTLDSIASALLEKETLEQDDFDIIIAESGK